MKGKNLIEYLSGRGKCLGNWLEGNISWLKMDEAVRLGHELNPFFSPYMQSRAMEALVSEFLNEQSLSAWLSSYGVSSDATLAGDDSPRCGIVAAGNIPAVATHDILCAYAAGMKPVVKMSSKDKFLLPLIFPDAEYVNSADSLYGNVDVLLTMGGNTAAKALREKFAKFPKIVRGSRYTLAVLKGDESEDELSALAEDMLLYYGLGCRNVTLLLVPNGYSFTKLSIYLKKFAEAHFENFYFDFLRRERAVAVLSEDEFVDGECVLYKKLSFNGLQSPFEGECNMSQPPIATLWYLPWEDECQIEKFISFNKDNIQKIITNFGSAPRPVLHDYPDGIDTVRFLIGLKD